jgi:hypothetical protein
VNTICVPTTQKCPEKYVSLDSGVKMKIKNGGKNRKKHLKMAPKKIVPKPKKTPGKYVQGKNKHDYMK